jgi:hypothetical protein
LTAYVYSTGERRLRAENRPHARIIATHSTNGVVDRTRPLCAYPEVARYAGSGSTDDAANFVYRRP